MPTQTGLAEFKEVLTKRMELLKKILQLTKEQPFLIQQEDVIDELMKNIEKRQEYIDELDALAEQLPELDKDVIRRDAECARMAEEAQKLLLDIQEQDKKNESVALGKMEELRGQLRKANEGQTTLRGYEGAAAKGIGGMYFDKQK